MHGKIVDFSSIQYDEANNCTDTQHYYLARFPTYVWLVANILSYVRVYFSMLVCLRGLYHHSVSSRSGTCINATQNPHRPTPSCLGDREDFVTDFMLQCYIYTVERNELFQKISSCGSNISRFTSSWQICISRDFEWLTHISMGWQICPQFIWQAKKWYTTVRDDSFCVSAASLYLVPVAFVYQGVGLRSGASRPGILS